MKFLLMFIGFCIGGGSVVLFVEFMAKPAFHQAAQILLK